MVSAFPSAEYRPIHSEFAAIAQSVPGFGGAYREADGTTVIVLRDTAALPAAKDALQRTFSKPKDRPLGQVRAVVGSYDIPTLLKWNDQSIELLSIPGVELSAIDFQKNRVLIGISSESAIPTVEAMLNQLSIPTDAVSIEHREKVFFASLLTDRVRPIVNGYQIGNSNGPCALGVNAGQSGTGTAYFLEPSHCTNVEGSLDLTSFYQPDPFTDPTRFALELSDVTFFTGAGCPAGRSCQYADAALVKYDRDADMDPLFTLPVTDTRSGPGSAGSINVSYTQPIYAVEGYDASPAMQGDVIDKVGPVSGWTYGSVLDPCANRNVGNSSFTLLCQTEIGGWAEMGDSGSPTFSSTGSTFYYPYGMLVLANASHTLFDYTPMSAAMAQLRTNDFPLAFCAC